MAGRFFWYELMTTDLAQSAPFFAQLLDADLLRVEESPLLLVAKKGTEDAPFGLLPIEKQEGVLSHWLGSIGVSDLAQAGTLVREKSGEVHAWNPEELDGTPQAFTVVTDPQGAVLTLRADVQLPPLTDTLPEVGEIAWVELLTSDREQAAAFYTELFGWEIGPEHERTDEGKAHALFHEERIFGLIRDLPPGSPQPPAWVYYVRVPNLEAAIKQARSLGAYIFEDPAAVDGGQRALLIEPTGALLGLWAADAA